MLWACTQCFTVLDYHTHIHGSSWVLHLSPHLHSIHVCVGCFSLTRPTPLSTSQPSSSLSPSSTSATSSRRSSTRRTWETCATPLPNGVTTPTTSSTSTHFTRGEFGKGDVLIADLEELDTMDASEIYSKRLNTKEVIFPKSGEFIFPIADGRIKTLGGDQELRTSTLGTASTLSRREQYWLSWRIRRVSSTTSRLTSGMPVKR